MRTAALAVALFSFAAFADDLSPETVAKIRAEQKSAKNITQKVYAEIQTAERDEGNEQCESAHGRGAQKSRR